MNYVPIIIPIYLEESWDEVDPVEPICDECGHDLKHHENNGRCNKGLFNKCDCRKFKLNKPQLRHLEDELHELKERILSKFKNLEQTI